MKPSHTLFSFCRPFGAFSHFTTGILLLGIVLLTACDAERATDARSAAQVVAKTPATDMAARGEDAMTEANYRRHIEILASDEFEGRAPASAGEQLTVDYISQAFSGRGLEPANGDSYTQDLELFNGNAMTYYGRWD